MTRTGPLKIHSPHSIVGLEDTERGHTIVTCVASHPSYGDGMRATCACGHEIHFALKKSGAVNLHGLRAWTNHLEAVREPDLRIEVGTITRSKWTETIFVTTAANATTIAKGKTWPRNPFAIVCDRGNGAPMKILSTGGDRGWTVSKAQAVIRKAELEGLTVTFADGAVTTSQTPESVGQRALRMLNLIDATTGPDATLQEMQEALDQIDEFLRLAPLVESRRNVLAAERERRLLKPRRRAS